MVLCFFVIFYAKYVCKHVTPCQISNIICNDIIHYAGIHYVVNQRTAEDSVEIYLIQVLFFI